MNLIDAISDREVRDAILAIPRHHSGNDVLQELSTSAWFYRGLLGTGTVGPQEWGVYGIVIAAGVAETMTLADPLRPGLLVVLTAITVGASGTRTLTYSAGYDSVGDSTLQFTATRQTAAFFSVPDKTSGGTTSGYRWELIGGDVAGINTVFNNLTLTGLLYESAADTIAAAGSTQAAATPLTLELNRVTTATANQGVRLPTSAPGLTIIVENHSGAQITVYGASTDKIDDVATATGVSQMDSSVVIYSCYTAGNWYTNGLATGYAKNNQGGSVLETVQFADAVAAAGSTQAGGTQLVAGINTVATVTAGQGVNLPASAAGLAVTVINTGANPLLVYPAQGASDTINGVAAANGVSINIGSVATFNCTAAGAWTVMTASAKMAAFNTNSTAPSANNVNLSAANITGGVATTDLSYTGAAGAGFALTLPTVAAMVLALHAPTVGTSFKLRILNTGSTQIGTVTTNTGWTVTGTATIANNTWRDFVITLNSLTTATIQNVGGGNIV